MKPYYEDGLVTIFCGDCREVAPGLSWDVLVSDPPWGAGTETDARRFSRAASAYWSATDTSRSGMHVKIHGDDVEFDPRPWIKGPAVLWGANWFPTHLPKSGGWLVWDKREGIELMSEAGWPLGEAELAWTNVIGAPRVFRNRWSGMNRSDERGQFFHPTQKPLKLMAWCLSFCPPGTVLDPFCGSGSTLRAAKDSGRRAIGIEIEEKYCEIAARRCAQEVLL